VRIGGDGEWEALDVLCESFRDYPVMRYVLGTTPDYERRLEVLLGFFLHARILRKEPILAVMGDGGITAVGLVSDPAGPASPAELTEARDRTWAELGADAHGRYDAFAAACQPLLSRAPRLHLNMLGVRRSEQRKGLGRAVLQSVHQLAVEHPTATGVSLTTESRDNLPFYRSAGYAVTGQTAVTTSLATWALFRPNAEEPA
jgi:GNAT superfamily N-acetyltransferase